MLEAAQRPQVERAPTGALRARLGEGRWHFQHGPIDLVVGAEGDAESVCAFVEAAWARMQTILGELVRELSVLRAPVAAGVLRGPVARRMEAACLPHGMQFITPMAAVAGAVADELIACAREYRGLLRAHVNNGGDIALHLAPGAHYRVGLFADLGRIERGERWRFDGDAEIGFDTPVRGVATSGWRGRSQSLGIADAVTVLAGSAAQADAAATMIANAVDCEHPSVVRRPARELRDDSDLGARLVTVAVGALPGPYVDAALQSGAAFTQSLAARGLVVQAMLSLQGRSRIVAARSAAGRAQPQPLEQTR
jgi:ApbE superfamily uncharacterized protein (UPF0280 family)